MHTYWKIKFIKINDLIKLFIQIG